MRRNAGGLPISQSRAYPTAARAPWPYRLPDNAADLDALRREIDEVASQAQYGWGHTIDFGPFQARGLLGEKYLQVAGVLDAWGWWPRSLDGQQVADVGAFTGGLSLLMASRGAERVVAVDEVPEHLDQCRLVARAFDVDTVQPVAASLYDLPEHLEPGSLDLVLLSGVLYHLSDMLVGLVVLQRLLKPGGILLIESNAVECYQHSYANFGRFFEGMWWQPTALAVQDMCELAGLSSTQVRFYKPGRCIARSVKPSDARVPFKRGMNLQFADLRDEYERTRESGVLAPAPCRHVDARLFRRLGSSAYESGMKWLISRGYRAKRALQRRS